MIQKYRESAFLHIYAWYFNKYLHTSNFAYPNLAREHYNKATLYYRSSAGAYYV